MKLYKKYVLFDLLKVNLLLWFLFFVFYFLVDFFDKLGEFLSFKKPFYLFLEYLFWKSLVNIYEFFPFACGLSGILLLLWLARTGELLAFFSLGFSKKSLISLIIIGILILGIFGGFIIIFVFPKAAFLNVYTWDFKIAERKKQYLVFKEQIFLRGLDYYLIAKPLEPKGEYLQDILIVFLENENPKNIVWAKEGYYQNNKWILKEVILQKLEDNFYPKIFKESSFKFPFKPDTLVIVEKPLKFLSIKELFKRMKYLKKVGRPYQDILAEMFLKVIYPFIPFFLSFFPCFIFLKNYIPSHIVRPFLKSLFSFFILLVIFLFLEILLRKGIIFSGLILFSFMLINFSGFLLILRRA